MKTSIILFVGVVVFSSCMHTTCPTYSGLKGHEYSASTRKSRDLKNKEPYYKTVKRAEQD